MNQKAKLISLLIILLLVGLACRFSAPQKETPVVTAGVTAESTVAVQATPTESIIKWNGDGAGTLAREHLASISQELPIHRE